MKNLWDPGVTKTMTMVIIWWFRWRWWQCWWRTCGTPVWPPRPPAQGQDGLPDQGGDQEIAICCTPVISSCQQSQRTVKNNMELKRNYGGQKEEVEIIIIVLLQGWLENIALVTHYTSIISDLWFIYQTRKLYAGNFRKIYWFTHHRRKVFFSHLHSILSLKLLFDEDLFCFREIILIQTFKHFDNMQRHVSSLTKNWYSFFRGCHYGNKIVLKLLKGVDGRMLVSAVFQMSN